MIALLSRPEVWILLVLLCVGLLWLARRVRLRWLPAWGLRALLVWLVLLGLLAPRSQSALRPLAPPQVLVVDQSDSIPEIARQSARLQAQAWQQAGENRLVVTYGAQARAVPRAAGNWPAAGGRASDLAGALELAAGLAGDAAGRVILASDGRADAPAAVDAAVERLARQGIRLDAAPLSTRQDPRDGAVGPLSAPPNLWAGTPFDLVVPVYPPQAGGEPVLQLQINGQASQAQAERLSLDQVESLGPDFYRFRVPSLPEGIAALQVTAGFGAGGIPADPFPANNSSFAALQVFAAPRVLFVSAGPRSAAAERFTGLLAGNGVRVDAVTPEEMPTDTGSLQTYRVIFLHDLQASHLSREQMLSLQVFVSRLAGGLVFLGGRHSYTLGGYNNTLLEPMLPVRLEPPPRSERPPIVFLLILDRSSSMNAASLTNAASLSGGEPQAERPIALAREAAMRAIETMQPQDYVGLLTFTDQFSWNVPVHQLGSGLGLREVLDAVSRVEATGGTQMYQAMAEGLTAVSSLPPDAPPSRHVLILSDGQSSDGSLETFRQLAQSGQQAGITFSTIAFGEDADTDVMAEIAEAGNGRYYAVSQAGELPRILIYESQAARSENIQAGQTSLKPGESGHPVLSGMSPGQLPVLSGYNALTSRNEESAEDGGAEDGGAEDGAEDILLSSSFGDPLLSTWQYRLGRVVAWMGDLGEEWTGAWPAAQQEGYFWTQVVRYAQASPALGPAQVSVQVEAARLSVAASILDAAGLPVNHARVRFSYADAAGEIHSFSMPQTAPGLYDLDLPLPPEGAYRAAIGYQDENGQSFEAPAPFAVNPPGEWLPQPAAAGEPDPARSLQRWAERTGGSLALLETHLASATQREDGAQGEVSTRSSPWWQWALLALVLLWPLEIALRRRWLPWS